MAVNWHGVAGGDRAYFRSVLKQQMDDKATDQRDAFMGRVWESEMALQHDLQSANEDAAKAQIKRTAFLSYRDANKLVSYSLIWRNVGYFIWMFLNQLRFRVLFAGNGNKMERLKREKSCWRLVW